MEVMIMADLLDSGNRRQFDSGAVRDVREGKGRCDLLPLDVICNMIDDSTLRKIVYQIHLFMHSSSHSTAYLFSAVDLFCQHRGWTKFEAVLEVSKQYEDGAKKYGEHNWEKGIPIHCYIDSGVRHLMKYADGMTDEPHDRAFVWNMIGAIWTACHKHDLRDTSGASLDATDTTPHNSN